MVVLAAVVQLLAIVVLVVAVLVRVPAEGKFCIDGTQICTV